jgi:hypothetical protein
MASRTDISPHGRNRKKATPDPATGVRCCLLPENEMASRAGIEPASIEPESIVLSFGPSGHGSTTVFTVLSLYVVEGLISIRTFLNMRTFLKVWTFLKENSADSATA